MASRGINKVILVGNLGSDPEVRYIPNGTAVANVNLATSDIRKDRQSGEQTEYTEWHRLVFFNRLAEIVGEYLHKGSKIFVEGSLRTRKWQDKNGMERYTTEIVASEMLILDSKNANNPPHELGFKNETSQPASSPSSSPIHTESLANEDFDDDVPF